MWKDFNVSLRILRTCVCVCARVCEIHLYKQCILNVLLIPSHLNNASLNLSIYLSCFWCFYCISFPWTRPHSSVYTATSQWALLCQMWNCVYASACTLLYHGRSLSSSSVLICFNSILTKADILVLCLNHSVVRFLG